MPIYEYICQKCNKQHEIIQKITDKPLAKCPGCGGKLKKMISNTSFVLKGTGWYATDYASNKEKSTASAGAAGKTKESKTTKKEEAKTEKTSGVKEAAAAK
jgi:putative FmdB family regulatory protein